MKSRILVIDDESAIRDSLKMILEYDGYDVQGAATGQDGLVMVDRDQPELVLLDIKMAGMDGLEVLQRLKAGHEALPVVMISGTRHGQHRRRGHQARRVRLHRETAVDRARAGDGPQRARPASAGR